MHPDDLPLYTKLQPGRIVQRQHIVLHKPFAEVGNLHAFSVAMLLPQAAQCQHTVLLR